MTDTDERGSGDPYSLHATVRYADLILSALDAGPDRTAFIWQEQARLHAATFGDIAQQIRRLSTALGTLGIAQSEGLAFLTGPRPEAFTVMAAACHAGIRYSALHPMATSHDDEYLLRDSRSAVLVVDDNDERMAERARNANATTTVLALRELMTLAEQAAPSTSTAAEATYLFYTGGTTGEPKGVILRDRSLTANAWASATWPWPANTRLLLSTPMSHAAGLLVAPGLLRGAQFHIHDHFDSARVLHAIEHGDVNAAFVVPTMLYALLDHPDAVRITAGQLQWLLYGAAPAIVSRVIDACRQFGPVLTQHYGQAESPNALTMLDQKSHGDGDDAILASCGRPMPGVHIDVLDPTGAPVPNGTPGELCVRGPLVMDGYWNKPEQTAAALAGGWLHTGDVAVRDHTGRLTLVDRLKDVIITGGFNIYPREVEDVLGAHPAVAACAVYGEPHEQWGESVVASVVLRAASTATADELVTYVRSTKGSVWTPKRIDFVEQLPLTNLGKIDRKALKATPHA